MVTFGGLTVFIFFISLCKNSFIILFSNILADMTLLLFIQILLLNSLTDLCTEDVSEILQPYSKWFKYFCSTFSIGKTLWYKSNNVTFLSILWFEAARTVKKWSQPIRDKDPHLPWKFDFSLLHNYHFIAKNVFFSILAMFTTVPHIFEHVHILVEFTFNSLCLLCDNACVECIYI